MSKNGDIFILNAIKKHNGKYNYSSVDYKNNKTKVKIICIDHGVFNQRPNDHLNGQGCPFCKKIKLSKIKTYTNEDLILRFKEIHKDKYDYISVNYCGYDNYVDITCKKHGIFRQTPHRHISGMGCRKCADDKLRHDKVDFIKKANIIHNNKYSYCEVNYKNNKTNVDIICPTHGIFVKKPQNHIYGEGCPKCKISQYESIVINWLKSKNIEYIYQKKFTGCVFKKQLKFDFYIPKKEICIEVDGIQHRKPIAFFGGEEEFKKLIIKDEIKNKFCLSNNIKLIRLNTDSNMTSILENYLL